MIVSVAINFPDGTSTTAAVQTPDPASWTEGDARELVWAVWRLLKAHDGASLQVREMEPPGVYRLEFAADSGLAVTEPLTLTMAQVVWLQIAAFDLLPPGPLHCEIDPCLG